MNQIQEKINKLELEICKETLKGRKKLKLNNEQIAEIEPIIKHFRVAIPNLSNAYDRPDDEVISLRTAFNSKEVTNTILQFYKNVEENIIEEDYYGFTLDELTTQYCYYTVKQLENNRNLFDDNIDLVVKELDKIIDEFATGNVSINILQQLLLLGTHISNFRFLVSLTEDYFIKIKMSPIHIVLLHIMDKLEEASKMVSDIYYNWEVSENENI